MVRLDLNGGGGLSEKGPPLALIPPRGKGREASPVWRSSSRQTVVTGQALEGVVLVSYKTFQGRGCPMAWTDRQEATREREGSVWAGGISEHSFRVTES